MRIIRGTAVIALLVCTALLSAACGADSGGSPETPQAPESPQSPAAPAESPSTASPTSPAAPTSPLAVPTPPASPGSTAESGEPAAASVSLTVDFKTDGTTTSSTWTLQCNGAEPLAGSAAPDPARACALLSPQGKAALAEPAPDLICTQESRGMQRAHVTGTVNGEAVDTTFSLRDGCQISRWERLTALLGPADGTL